MLSEKIKDIDLSRPEHMCKNHRPLKMGDLVFIRDMVFEVIDKSLDTEYYIIQFLEYTNFTGKTKRPEIPC